MPVKQKEQINPCEISLEIEVEPEVVKKAFDQAYQAAGKDVEVPGFRKGKAPRAMLERYVSEERVREHAAEALVPAAYEEALRESGIEPFGMAEYEVIHLADAEPLTFKARVPLKPTVELGQYTGLKVERLTHQVTDEDVEHEIGQMLERSASVKNVEGRPAQIGDLVITQSTEPDQETEETVVEVGKNLPSFDEGLSGMNIGETKTIEIVYPENFEDKELAGTKSSVVVTLKDIKERQVPELNDEFAKQIGKHSEDKIETVEDLKSKIRDTMEQAVAEIADRGIRAQILDKITTNSTVCFPSAILEHEVSHRLRDLIEDLKEKELTLDDYLDSTGETFDQLRSRLEKSAKREIEVTLILEEIAEKESIGVSDEEFEAEIDEMAEHNRVPRESIMAYLDKTGGVDVIRNRIKQRKVLDFLVHASNIKNVGQESS